MSQNGVTGETGFSLLHHFESKSQHYLYRQDLFFHSPELNPDEKANADINPGATIKAPARTKLQLVRVTARHLHSVQNKLERIRSYFEHEPVRYARLIQVL